MNHNINNNSIITLTKTRIKMTQSQYKYPFEPASQDRLFNIEGYTAHMFEELMLARPNLFNETNNTIEKFAAKYPNVDIRTFRHGFVDKVSDKKAANEGIPRVFIKCNKNNQHAIAFVPTVWCDQHFWNQPEPVVEQPVVAPVIDVPIVEDVVVETATVPVVEVVPPPNVSIPELDPIPPPTASNPNQKPPTKIFNGREFYCANELKEKYPQIFCGLKQGKIRDIIRVLDIPKDTECVYAMLVKKDWKLMSESVDKAKLFISKDWCDEFFWEALITLKEKSHQIKCIYAIKLGTVGEFRIKYDISEKYPDDFALIKYGRGKFKNRLKCHKLTFGVNIETIHVKYIDPLFEVDAEVSVKNRLNGLILDIPSTKIHINGKDFKQQGQKELFVLEYTETNKGWLKNVFEEIGEKYRVRSCDLEIKELRKNK